MGRVSNREGEAEMVKKILLGIVIAPFALYGAAWLIAIGLMIQDEIRYRQAT